MFEKLVANLLASKLGRFIEDLNTDAVKVNLWKGNVVLKNVKLRRSALRDLGLPVYVETGLVETLTVIIPWSRLRSESVRVELDGMKVTVKSRRPEDWNSETEIMESHRSKMEKLDAAEGNLNDRILQAAAAKMMAAQQDENNSKSGSKNNNNKDDDDSNKGSSTLERWQLTMANNLQVAITRVSVCFIDDFSQAATNTEKNFTLHIDKLLVQSCADDTWKPAFIERASDDLRKLITLGGCSLTYHESSPSSSSTSSLTTTTSSSSSRSRKSVLNPFDLTLRAKQSAINSQSTWSIQVFVSSLGGILTRTQFDAARTIARFVNSVDDRAAFLVHRPNCKVFDSSSTANNNSPSPSSRRTSSIHNKNAALWWKYAINAVLTVLRRRSGTRKSRWNLDIYYLQKEYIGLYRRAVGTASSTQRLAKTFLQPLSRDEKRRVIKLELELPVETLVYARKVALQRLYQEEGYIKAKRAGSSDPIASAVRDFEKYEDSVMRNQQQQDDENAGNENSGYVRTAGRTVVAAGSAAGSVAYTAASSVARAGTGVVSWMFGYNTQQQKEEIAKQQAKYDEGLSVEERLFAEELATTNITLAHTSSSSAKKRSGGTTDSSSTTPRNQDNSASGPPSSNNNNNNNNSSIFSEEEAKEVAALSEKLGSSEWQDQQRRLLNDMFGEADSAPISTTTQFHVTIDVKEMLLDLADEQDDDDDNDYHNTSSFSSFTVSNLRAFVKHDQQAKTWDVNFTVLDLGIASESENLDVLKTEKEAATRNFLSVVYVSSPEIISNNSNNNNNTNKNKKETDTLIEKTKAKCAVKVEPFEISLVIPWLRRSYAFWQDDVDSIGAITSVVAASSTADTNANTSDNNTNSNQQQSEASSEEQKISEFRLAEYFSKNPRVTEFSIELERVEINVIDKLTPPQKQQNNSNNNDTVNNHNYNNISSPSQSIDEILAKTSSETSTRITLRRLGIENDSISLLQAMDRVGRAPAAALRDDWSALWKAKVESMSIDVFWNDFRNLNRNNNTKTSTMAMSSSGVGTPASHRQSYVGTPTLSKNASSSFRFDSSASNNHTHFGASPASSSSFLPSNTNNNNSFSLPVRSCTLLSDFPLLVTVRTAHLSPALMPPLLRLAGTQLDVTFPRGEFIFDATEPLALAAFMNSVTNLLDFSGDSRGLRAVERASKKALQQKQQQQQQKNPNNNNNTSNNRVSPSLSLAATSAVNNKKSFLALDEMNAVVLQCRGPFEGLWEGPSSSPTPFSFETFEPWTTNATPASSFDNSKKHQETFTLRSVHARYGEISIMHDSRPTYPMMKAHLKKNQFLTSVHPVASNSNSNYSSSTSRQWGTSLFLLRGGVAQPPNIARDVELAKATLGQYGIPSLPSVEQLRRCVDKVCEKLDAEFHQVSEIQEKLKSFGEDDPIPDALMASSIISQQLRGALKVVEIAGDLVPAKCVTFLHSTRDDAESFQHLLERVSIETPPTPPKIPAQLMSTVTMRMSMHTDKKFAVRVRRPHFDPLTPPPTSSNNFTEAAPCFFEASGSTTISYESTWSSTEFSLKTAEIQLYSQTPPGALNSHANNTHHNNSNAADDKNNSKNDSMTTPLSSNSTSTTQFFEGDTNEQNDESSSKSDQQRYKNIIPPSYTNPLPVVQLGGRPSNNNNDTDDRGNNSSTTRKNYASSASLTPSTSTKRDVLSSTSAAAGVNADNIRIPIRMASVMTKNSSDMTLSCNAQMQSKIRIDPSSCGMFETLLDVASTMLSWSLAVQQVQCKQWASEKPLTSASHSNYDDDEYDNNSKNDNNNSSSSKNETEEAATKIPYYSTNMLIDFTSGIEIEMFHDARALVGISSAKLNSMMMKEASKKKVGPGLSSASSSSIHPSLAKFVCSKLIGKWRMTEIVNMTSLNAQNPTLALTGKPGGAFLSPHPSMLTASPNSVSSPTTTRNNNNNNNNDVTQVPLGVSPTTTDHKKSGETYFSHTSAGQSSSSTSNNKNLTSFANSTLEFSFDIHYRPSTMSYNAWLSSGTLGAATSGFAFSYSLGLHLQRCCCTYRQTYLWDLLEYTSSSPVVKRMTWLTARKPINIHERYLATTGAAKTSSGSNNNDTTTSSSSSSSSSKKPPFYHLMTQQQIKLVDTVLFVSEQEEGMHTPVFCVHVPLMEIGSDLFPHVRRPTTTTSDSSEQKKNNGGEENNSTNDINNNKSHQKSYSSSSSAFHQHEKRYFVPPSLPFPFYGNMSKNSGGIPLNNVEQEVFEQEFEKDSGDPVSALSIRCRNIRVFEVGNYNKQQNGVNSSSSSSNNNQSKQKRNNNQQQQSSSPATGRRKSSSLSASLSGSTKFSASMGAEQLMAGSPMLKRTSKQQKNDGLHPKGFHYLNEDEDEDGEEAENDNNGNNNLGAFNNNNESFAYPKHTFPQFSNNIHMLYGEETEHHHQQQNNSSNSTSNRNQTNNENNNNNNHSKFLYHTPKWIFHQPQNWTPIVDMSEVRVTNYYTLAPMLLDLPLSWMAVDLPHFVSESSSASLASFLQVMHGIFYEKWRASYTVASYADNPYLGVLRTLRLPVLANTSRTRSPGRERDILPEADSCSKRSGLSREMFSQLLPPHDTTSYCFNFGNIFLCIHDADDDDPTTVPSPLTFNASDLTITLQWTSRGVTLTQTKIAGEVAVGFVNPKKHGMPSYEEFVIAQQVSSSQPPNTSNNHNAASSSSTSFLRSPTLRPSASTFSLNSSSLPTSPAGNNNNYSNSNNSTNFNNTRYHAEYQQLLLVHHEQRTFLSRKYPTKWVKVRERRTEGLPEEETKIFFAHHIQIDYSWSPVYGVHASYELGVARVNLLVDRLIDTKDTLLSLKMRNAFGRFLNWPDYVPGHHQSADENNSKKSSSSSSQQKEEQEKNNTAAAAAVVSYETVQMVKVAELQLCVFERAHSVSYYKMMKEVEEQKRRKANMMNPLMGFGIDEANVNSSDPVSSSASPPVPILNSPPARLRRSASFANNNIPKGSSTRQRSKSQRSNSFFGGNNIMMHDNNEEEDFSVNKPLVEASLLNFALDQYYAPKTPTADMVVALDSISLFAYEKPPMEFSFSSSSKNRNRNNHASETMKKLLKPAMEQLPSGVTPLVIDLTLSQDNAHRDFHQSNSNSNGSSSSFVHHHNDTKMNTSSSSFNRRPSFSSPLNRRSSSSNNLNNDPYRYSVPRNNNSNNNNNSSTSDNKNDDQIFRGESFEETAARSASSILFVKYTAKSEVYFIEAKNIWLIMPSLPVLQKVKKAFTELQNTDIVWIGEHREERHVKKLQKAQRNSSSNGHNKTNTHQSSPSPAEKRSRDNKRSTSSKSDHLQSKSSKQNSRNNSPEQHNNNSGNNISNTNSQQSGGIDFDDDAIFENDHLAASLAKTLRESKQKYNASKEKERQEEQEKALLKQKNNHYHQRNIRSILDDDDDGVGVAADTVLSDDEDPLELNGGNNRNNKQQQQVPRYNEDLFLQSKPPKLLYDFSLPDLGIVVTEDGDWSMAAVLMTGSVCSFQVDEVYYRLSDEELEQKWQEEKENLIIESLESANNNHHNKKHYSRSHPRHSANHSPDNNKKGSSTTSPATKQQQEQNNNNIALDESSLLPIQRTLTGLPGDGNNNYLQEEQQSSPPLTKHNEESGINFDDVAVPAVVDIDDNPKLVTSAFGSSASLSQLRRTHSGNNNNSHQKRQQRHPHQQRSSSSSPILLGADDDDNEQLDVIAKQRVSPFVTGSRYSMSVIGLFVKMLNSDQVVVDPVSASLRATIFAKRQLEIAAQVHKIAVTVDRGHYETLLRVIVRHFIKDEKDLVEQHANRRQNSIAVVASPNNKNNFSTSAGSFSSPFRGGNHQSSSDLASPSMSSSARFNDNSFRNNNPNNKRKSIHLSRQAGNNNNNTDASLDLDQEFLSPDQQFDENDLEYYQGEENVDDQLDDEGGYDKMEVHVDLSGFQFNIAVEDDCVVEMKLGGMSAMMSQEKVRIDNINEITEHGRSGDDPVMIAKITLHDETDDLDKTVVDVNNNNNNNSNTPTTEKSSSSWTDQHLDRLAAKKKQDALQNAKNKKRQKQKLLANLTSQKTRIQGNLEEVLLGLRHRRALFQVKAVEKQPISFQTSSTSGKESVITGSLGMASLWLDPVTVEIVTNFLYEPYRRIVLPKYGVTDLLLIEDDVKLDEALILTKRQLVRISSVKKNYIKIDCQGHAIHFLPTLSPVILLDPGCTLELCNGKVFLYSGVKSVDAAVSGGNGSYTVLNRIEVITADDENGMKNENDFTDHQQGQQQQQNNDDDNDEDNSAPINDVRSPHLGAGMKSANNSAFIKSIINKLPRGVKRTIEAARKTTRQRNHLSVGLSIALPDYAGLRELCLSVGVILEREVTPFTKLNEDSDTVSNYLMKAADAQQQQQRLNQILDATAVSKVSASFENFQASCRYYEVTTNLSGGGSGSSSSSRKTANNNNNHHQKDFFKHNYSYTLREIDFSSLITPWTFKLLVDQTITKQIVAISAERGVDLRLRCGDVAVVVDAVDSASQAIKSVEESVGSTDPNLAAAQSFLSGRNKRSTDDDDTTTEGESSRNHLSGNEDSPNSGHANNANSDETSFRGIVAPTKTSKSTKILINFPQLGIYLVDDSSSIDMPLIYITVFGVHAPTFDMMPTGTTVGHLQLKMQVEHYSSEAGLWQPLIEKVALDFAFRDTAPEPDSTDDSKKEPSKRAGVNFGTVHVHLTPPAIEMCVRASNVFTAVMGTGSGNEQHPSSAAGTSSSSKRNKSSSSDHHHDPLDPRVQQKNKMMLSESERKEMASGSGSMAISILERHRKYLQKQQQLQKQRQFLQQHQNHAHNKQQASSMIGTGSNNNSNLNDNDNNNNNNTTASIFRQYEIRQNLGHLEVTISFADDAQGRFPKPFTLRFGENHAFNYPRIDGQEIPIRQHMVLITVENSRSIPIFIGSVGESSFQLPPGSPCPNVVVDIFLQSGQKVVELRLPIKFENELPFPVQLGGVLGTNPQDSLLEPNSTKHLTAEPLRRRCVFRPIIDGLECGSAHLGLHYEDLHFLFGQVFLASFPILGFDDGSNNNNNNSSPNSHHSPGSSGGGIMFGSSSPESKNSNNNNNNNASMKNFLASGEMAAQRAVYALVSFSPLKMIPNVGGPVSISTGLEDLPSIPPPSSNSSAPTSILQRPLTSLKQVQQQLELQRSKTSTSSSSSSLSSGSAASSPIASSLDVSDITVTLQPPFYIQNHTGVPIKVGLYYRQRFVGRQNQEQNMKVDAGFSFAHIVTLPIEVEQTTPITQVSPLHQVYLDVMLTQPTGEVLSRTSSPPALVRSEDSSERASTLVIHDQKGQPLTLLIDYKARLIVLRAPFWIVNHTMHYLQFQFPSLLSTTPCSGVGVDGVPPMSKQPFLVGGAADASTSSIFGLMSGLGKDDYEKRQQLRSKWKIQARIGRYEDPTSGIIWTKWSEPIGLGSVIDIGDIVCPLEKQQDDGSDAISLSFSNHLVGGVIQDTMVMTFRARWIVLNRSNFDLSVFRGYASTDGEFQTFQKPKEKKKSSSSSAPADDNENDESSKANWQYNSENDKEREKRSAIEPFAALRPQSSVAIELCRRGKINANCIKIQCTTNSYYTSRNLDRNKVSPFDTVGSGSTSQVITDSEKSPTIPIDLISEYNLNIRYIKVHKSKLRSDNNESAENQTQQQQSSSSASSSSTSNKQQQQSSEQRIREFVVFRVSIYTRTSVMFVVIDQMKNPPFQVENRTPYLVCVKQESSLQELLLYPFSTRGFVWEKEYESHVLELDLVIARNRVAQTTLDLDPLLVVRRTMRQLKKEILIPGSQQRVFVRTRAKKDTFCISLTLDRRIDSMLTRPFAQLRFDLVMQGLFVLLADTDREQRRNIALLSLPEVFASFAQGRLAEQGAPPEDVQKIEFSFGSLQLEKWVEDGTGSDWTSSMAEQDGFTAVNAQTNIILSMLASQSIKKNSLVILRRKDRSVPVLHIRYLAVILQPLLVTVDDPFLEDVLLLVDRVNASVSAANSSNGSSSSNNNGNSNSNMINPSGSSSTFSPADMMKLPNKKILELNEEAKELNRQHSSSQHHNNNDDDDDMNNNDSLARHRTRSMIMQNASNSASAATGLVSSVSRNRAGSTAPGSSSGGNVNNFFAQQYHDYSSILFTPITSSIFETTPWSSELSAKSSEESEFMFKTVVIDSMLLEQFVASVTLVRGTDVSGRDPIKERLGVLSVLVQSVDDARFDFHRIQKQNVYGKIWLLGTQLGHYYLARLKNQALNVVHIAVLDDLMRDVVNDLLDGYFTSAKVNIDRTREILSRKKDTSFQYGVDTSADAEALMLMKRGGSGLDDGNNSKIKSAGVSSSRGPLEPRSSASSNSNQQSRSSSLKTYVSEGALQSMAAQSAADDRRFDESDNNNNNNSFNDNMSSTSLPSPTANNNMLPSSSPPSAQQQSSGPRVVQSDRGFIIFPDLSKGIPLFVTDKESVGIFRKLTRFVTRTGSKDNNNKQASGSNNNNNNSNPMSSKSSKKDKDGKDKPIFCRCKLVSSALKKGQFPKESYGSAWIRLEELCHHSSWEELVQLLPPKELRNYGLLIAQLHARWRPLTVFTGVSNSLVGPGSSQHYNQYSPANEQDASRRRALSRFERDLATDEAGFGCNRCTEIEEIRHRKLAEALATLNVALEQQRELVAELRMLRKDEHRLQANLRDQQEKEEEFIATMKEGRDHEFEDDSFSGNDSDNDDDDDSRGLQRSSSLSSSSSADTASTTLTATSSNFEFGMTRRNDSSSRKSSSKNSIQSALPTELRLNRIQLLQDQEELYQRQQDLESVIDAAKKRIALIFQQVRMIESPLPHPTKTALLSWEELCHHASWQEFTSMTNDTELRRYGSLVQQALLGLPRNITRVEKSLLWVLDV